MFKRGHNVYDRNYCFCYRFYLDIRYNINFQNKTVFWGITGSNIAVDYKRTHCCV